MCVYLCQVITALISNFQRLGDTLKEVRAGEWKFVFLCKGPIYVRTTRTHTPHGRSECPAQHTLTYVHVCCD